MRTLHIRCGSDIRDRLQEAGFTGDFLEYSDPVCQGPVPDSPKLLWIRAHFIAQAYGAAAKLTEPAVLFRLRDAEQRLGAAHLYERVVLWFEHDSYDQLLLARCLARLADTKLPACLELICIDHHPDVPRFRGLGQLHTEALAGLWPERKPVTAEQIALGQAIWQALRAPNPVELWQIAQTGTPALPIAAPALRRHLRELPGVNDGLSMTQRLILQALAPKEASIGGVFIVLNEESETLPFLGDIQILTTIEDMARTSPPVLRIAPAEQKFEQIASITEAGQAVLAGTTDYRSLETPERWVGGVPIGSGAPDWRFDAEVGPVLRDR